MGRHDYNRPQRVEEEAIVDLRRYFVAEGKSIICKRGVIAEGEEVFPEKDGIGRFQEFLEKGYLEER